MTVPGVIHLATEQGLVSVDPAGVVRGTGFEGHPLETLDVRDGRLVVASEKVGVHVRVAPGSPDWEELGLEGAMIWVVTPAPRGGVYVGIEPAALIELGGDGAVRFTGLESVVGYSEWYSPWGPADLCAVCLEGDRIVVGVEAGGVAVSEDRGVTWAARNEGLYEDVHAVVIDGPLWSATTGMGFHMSRDAGAAWTWEMDGVDRGYTQALARTGDVLLMSSASGPPPFWEEGGPEAALFRSEANTPVAWELVCEGFAGNVERQGIAAVPGLVAAGTTAGELLVSRDGGREFELVRDDLPPIAAVAIEP
ncbi:MAG: hypothetical protein IT198_15145 [Acidimicrobiia bacterium]|nr:hypothetical protein [Acidimicrobiia bacterium]